MNAIKDKIGDEILENSLRITKASINYTITGEGDDIGVYVVGSGQSDSGEWVDKLDCSPWYSEKTGTISTDDAQFENCDVGSYTFIGIAAKGKGTGDLTLNVTNVELEVSYAPINSVPVTGTATYTFDDRYLVDETKGGSVEVGNVEYEPFEKQICVGDWVGNNVEALDGITTIGKFAAKYGSVELKFTAADIEGNAEVYAMIQTGDESKGEYEEIYFPAQDIKEGKNVYTADFGEEIKTAYDTFQSISVHIRAKEQGKTATMMLGNYDSTYVSATGTETFKSELDEDISINITTPEWWDSVWGTRYEGGFGVWYFGMGEEPNTCPVNTIPELYSAYKSGEISFNVKGLNENVTYLVALQTRDGNNFEEPIVLADNLKLQNGNNVVKFDLPKIMYKYPDIWGLYLRMSADNETTFTVGKPESSTPSEPSTPSNPSIPSTPSTSEPATSELTSSEPATSDTNEVFKTEDKPIENIMEEVKPDTTASIEVAAEDTSIKADVFEAAKEKKVTLELKLENGVKWEIKAETIGDAVADVNINVALNTSTLDLPRSLAIYVGVCAIETFPVQFGTIVDMYFKSEAEGMTLQGCSVLLGCSCLMLAAFVRPARERFSKAVEEP